MKIVSPNTSEATDIKIIPRANAQNVVVYIHNEATKSVSTYNCIPTYISNYMVLNAIFLFDENQSYVMEVYDGSSLIYRDKMFCTSQTDLAKYDINNERFVEAPSSATTFKF